MSHDAFLVVHFEPRDADDESFGKLAEMVGIADRYHAKLTMEFTPQWAEMSLADSAKLKQLRAWQRAGHEVAAQHHGPLHGWDWDGYTDLPEAEWSKRREKPRAEIRETARRGGDHGNKAVRFVEQEERYLGTMKDYVELLKRLAGLEPMRCMAMGPDRDHDWPAEFPYSTDSATVMPDGSYRIDKVPGNSRPQKRIFNGHTVYELSFRPILNEQFLTLAKQDYEAASPGEAVGAALHVHDFIANPKVFLSWLEFLRQKDPDDAHHKAASQIFEEYLAVTR